MIAKLTGHKVMYNKTKTNTEPTLTMFFWLKRGEKIQIPIKAGHDRPTSEVPFKLCFADGQMVAQH